MKKPYICQGWSSCKVEVKLKYDLKEHSCTVCKLEAKLKDNLRKHIFAKHEASFQNKLVWFVKKHMFAKHGAKLQNDILNSLYSED